MKMKNQREMKIVFPNFWYILDDLMIIEESLGSIGYVMSIYPIVKVAIDNKGYTDNFMDYYEPISNSKSPIKISFYHWQWAIMQYEVNNYIEK